MPAADRIPSGNDMYQAYQQRGKRSRYKFAAAYFLIQSWLFYEVCSSPLKINRDMMDGSEIDDLSFNTTSTELPSQKPGNEDVDDSYSRTILSRLRRHAKHSSPCVSRIKIKWNECLGKRFPEIRCRRHSKACLSPNNVPPKCKETIEAILGKNGYCPIVTSCACAA
ncbi:hypothetical protein ACROYT_G036828 [Oculina patagonica]